MPTQREQQRQATRARLIEIARRRFGEDGYDQVSTVSILEEAGLARGALYHHFTDKAALLVAVYEDVEHELVIAVTTAAYSDPVRPLWERVVVGVRTFLDLASDPAVQRITHIDVPAVLGPDAWRELDERYGLGLVKRVLAQGVSEGVFGTEVAIDQTGRIVLAALNEAAATIADAPPGDRDTTLTAAESTLLAMLGALRASEGDAPGGD